MDPSPEQPGQSPLTDKEVLTLQVPKFTGSKRTGVATFSHLNHRGHRDVQKDACDKPDHVRAVPSKIQSGSVCQGSLRPSSGQGANTTHQQSQAVMLMEWDLEKGLKGLCQGRPSPDVLISKVARTRVPWVRPAQSRHLLAPPQKGHKTEATLTLKIFKLFCASCNKLFKAKCILCLFLKGGEGQGWRQVTLAGLWLSRCGSGRWPGAPAPALRAFRVKELRGPPPLQGHPHHCPRPPPCSQTFLSPAQGPGYT